MCSFLYIIGGKVRLNGLKHLWYPSIQFRSYLLS